MPGVMTGEPPPWLGRKKESGPRVRNWSSQFISVRLGMHKGACCNSQARTWPLSISDAKMKCCDDVSSTPWWKKLSLPRK